MSLAPVACTDTDLGFQEKLSPGHFDQFSDDDHTVGFRAGCGSVVELGRVFADRAQFAELKRFDQRGFDSLGPGPGTGFDLVTGRALEFLPGRRVEGGGVSDQIRTGVVTEDELDAS